MDIRPVRTQAPTVPDPCWTFPAPRDARRRLPDLHAARWTGAGTPSC